MDSLKRLGALLIAAGICGADALRGPPPPAQSSHGAINFLFMLRDSLPHADVWTAFFAGAPPSSWRAWAHCSSFDACQADRALRTLGVKVVATVPSRWCDDLVTAQAHLMRAALSDTSEHPGIVEKFVLLSDSTLPIKSFASVHRGLLATEGSSICMRPVNEWPTASINGTELRLVKHSQWVALSRRDAEEFVQRWPSGPELNQWDVPLMGTDGRANWSRTMNRSTFFPLDGTKSKNGTRSKMGRCADEEAAFALLFGAAASGSVESVLNRSRCHTYIEWKGTFMWMHGITPRVFFKVEEDTISAAYASTSFFFARKFAPTAEVPELMNLILAAPAKGARLTTSRALLDRWGER